jgi:hypothetical protein
MTPSSALGYSSGGLGREPSNLREEQEERQRLEKVNFDLKMKLFYQESSTKRSVSGQVDNLQSYPAIASSHSTEFMFQLEEKSFELEQRNILLVRAKQAIEALKIELEKQRVDSSRRVTDLDAQLKRLKVENDEFSYRNHENSLAYESRLFKADHMIASKELLRAATEEKIDTLKATVAERTRGEAELGLRLTENSANHDKQLKYVNLQYEKVAVDYILS